VIHSDRNNEEEQTTFDGGRLVVEMAAEDHSAAVGPTDAASACGFGGTEDRTQRLHSRLMMRSASIEAARCRSWRPRCRAASPRFAPPLRRAINSAVHDPARRAPCVSFSRPSVSSRC
jgi:hypothetical protein